MKPSLTVFLCSLCILLIQGCANYQLGTPQQNEYSRVYVEPVANDSSYPLLEASLTQALRKAINETGSLQTSSISSAQRKLVVNVSRADRIQLAAQPEDLGRGKKFALSLQVYYSLYDLNRDSMPIFENKSVVVEQDIFVDSDLTTPNAGNQVDSEYQAGPEVSRKIAQRIAESLTDLW